MPHCQQLAELPGIAEHHRKVAQLITVDDQSVQVNQKGLVPDGQHSLAIPTLTRSPLLNLTSMHQGMTM